MRSSHLLDAFQKLGERVPEGSRLELAGGAAMILGGHLERATEDADVLHAVPRLTELADHIEAVAREQDLAEGWLNDAAKAYRDVLPADYVERLEHVGTFENLKVFVLGRRDLLLLKLYAMRVGDIEDLRTLEPTDEEISWIESQLDRIARFRKDRAHRMELYLQQRGAAASERDPGSDGSGEERESEPE